jgi:phospholipid/cholesterol/gamma-HCH transport system permease protein
MNTLEKTSQYALLIYEALRSAYDLKTYWNNLLNELVKIGYESVPIVLLTSVFTGIVLALQTSYQLKVSFVPKSVIGAIVSESIILEIAVVIMSLVLAGKIGARIATELGAMRMSEQIDALESMGLNSVTFLVAPRVLAGLIMFPVLYIFAAVTGIAGGMAAGAVSGSVSPSLFMEGARQYFFTRDVIIGLIKALVFGFVITSIACYKGYYARGGAEGVGDSTTQTAVLGCIYVLVADFVLSAILL